MMKRSDSKIADPIRRGIEAAVCLTVVLGFAGASWASAGGIRVAIAPFEQPGGATEQRTPSGASREERDRGPFSWWGGDSSSDRDAEASRVAPPLPIAETVASKLSRRSVERVIPPGAFVARPVFDPQADEVRQWAYNAAVEAIIVGRVSAAEAEMGEGTRIEAVVRSGHSGAELSRHEVVMTTPANLDAAAEILAEGILSSLGYVPDVSGPEEAGSGSQAAGRTGPTAPRSDSGGGGRGLDASAAVKSFQADAPIEIKADEAEIITHGEDRELIFQNNVFVRQADVTLRSDRLEALYRKGESEPRKLVATGRVEVDQAGRRAYCDEATYLRDAERLTCLGHAQLVQGCDIVRGEAIVFDLSSDQARVEGAASIVIQPEDQPDGRCLTGGPL